MTFFEQLLGEYPFCAMIGPDRLVFSTVFLGWNLSKIYLIVDIDIIDVKGHLGVFSHVGLVVDRHVSASVFAQVSSLCGAPSEKKAYCEF